MDFQSAVPAFLLLGSSIATVVMRLRPDSQSVCDDQSVKNRWAVGFSLAVVAAVSTYVVSQTGPGASVVSQDQYLLAMLVTAVFVVIYYVCTSCTGAPSASPCCYPSDPSAFFALCGQGADQGQQNDCCVPDDCIIPPDPRMCCGGDNRNMMVNTDCPPVQVPVTPYPPCIDNVYNENCYSRPYIPSGAVPCMDTDERRFLIQWDRRMDCPKHREMILKGEYPFVPGTPNWQNRAYVEENSKMWYGESPNYAPLRDVDRNIVGRPMVDPTMGRNVRLSRIPGQDDYGDAGMLGMMTQDGKKVTMGRKQLKQQQNFLWGRVPPKTPRFAAPDITYTPQPYRSPDARDVYDAPPPAAGEGGVTPANYLAIPQDPRQQQEDSLPCTCDLQQGSLYQQQLTPRGPMGASSNNWKLVLGCAILLVLHRCYRSVLKVAKEGGRRTFGANLDPFQLLGENPSLLSEAIKQDTTLMMGLMSVVFIVLFSSIAKSAEFGTQASNDGYNNYWTGADNQYY